MREILLAASAALATNSLAAANASAGIKEYTFTRSLETKGQPSFGPVGVEFTLPYFDPAWGKLTSATLKVDTSYRFTGAWNHPASASGFHLWWVDLGGVGVFAEELAAGTGDVVPFFSVKALPGMSGSYDSGVIRLPTGTNTRTSAESLSALTQVGDIYAYLVVDPWVNATECLGDTCTPFVTTAIAQHQVTLSYVASVPEPATWTLLLGGFGFAGTIVRRACRLA